MESGSQPPPASPPPPNTTPNPPPPPYTPKVPTESRVRLGKTVWRLFMVANLGLGAYLFATANKQKDPGSRKGKAQQPVVVEAPPPPPPPQAESPPPIDFDFDYEPDIVPSATTDPPLPRKPIPEDEQKELFQWMLEEKRKIEPKDREEKKRIDKDKAVLKQFIRAQSVPRI